MTKLTIGAREFDLAPYKLGQLKKAAPILDRINANGGDIENMTGLTGALEDIVAVLAIGIAKVDPEATLDWIEDNVGIEDQAQLQAAFMELMRESGLASKGEAPAPLTPAEAATAGASTTE